jgi:two-component system chemotaxis response regulator CheY
MENLLGDLQIMVVDDQSTMRSIIRKLLDQEGIANVVEAENAGRALDLLRHPSGPRPDLVICDLYMDEMDGMQFVNLVRRDKVPALKNIPVIILTGETDEFVHDVTMQAGATRVLKKPISGPDLRDEFARAVGFGAARKPAAPAA